MYNNNFAIITPYYKEERKIIERAINSVNSQNTTDLSVKHYLIADGFPIEIENKKITHLILPNNHSDFGDTPRMMGATLAIREGCYGLMFLDADNTLDPSHINNAFNAHRKTGSDIVISRRNIISADGKELNDFNDDKNLKHVDTGCFIFFREAVYDALEWIKIPREYSVIGDRFFWKIIRSKKRRLTLLQAPTVNYTSLFASSYLSSGIPAPEHAKELNFTEYNDFNKSLNSSEKSIIVKRMFGNIKASP